MKIKHSFSLKDFNTFSVDIKSKFFVEVTSISDLKKVLGDFKGEKIFFLGGGSNTLFVDDWDGLVIKIDLKGFEVEESDEHVYIKSQGGEPWDDFVNWCVENDYGGAENMVMIPGTVGGAVTQNIAAYGQNITDVLFDIEVLDVNSLEVLNVSPEDCEFAYRSSKFKTEWRDKYIVTAATFKLKKDARSFELSYHERAGRYGSLVDELQSFAKEPYSLLDVKTAVENQRTKRLPHVDDYGTCGSFFKNPVISESKFNELAKRIEDLQCYPADDLCYAKNANSDDYVKIPAGRLLDELGWKGKWDGNVGVSEKHALCVVTNKGASGKEILNFISEMKESVKKAYDIELEEEVNIVL